MTDFDLKEALSLHRKWLNNKEGGVRADFSGMDLSHKTLHGANLAYAILRDTKLCEADLCNANLYNADLTYANFHGASCRGVYLDKADLRFADIIRTDFTVASFCNANICQATFIGCNLSDADFDGADLDGAYIRDTNIAGAFLRKAVNVPDMPWTSIVPEEGAFIGWKKVHQFIVKLEICAYAKRSNATGRKCRCSAAKVLDIQNKDGTPAIAHDGTLITSVTNTNVRPHTTYSVGETVLPDLFDNNRWEECTHGIHFFITRQEAVDY